MNVLRCCGQASESTAQRITGVTVTIHSYYSTGDSTQGGDIAVVRLPRALTFNNYVQPVCIPSTLVADGTNCVVTGWGRTDGTLYGVFYSAKISFLVPNFLGAVKVYCKINQRNRQLFCVSKKFTLLVFTITNSDVDQF